jgi:acetyl-CoA C-acetyltransferase
MGLDLKEKRHIINVNGRRIPLEHLVGATGAKTVITLLYEMRRRNVQYGLATLCGDGGLGMGMIIELPY